MIEEISKIVNIIKDIGEYLLIEKGDKFSVNEIKKVVVNENEERYNVIGWYQKENEKMKCYMVCNFNIEVEVNEKTKEVRISKVKMELRYYYKDE